MVLAQDQAQANQSTRILNAQEDAAAQIQYDKDMIQYEKDMKQYEADVRAQKAIEDKKRANAEKARAEIEETKQKAFDQENARLATVYKSQVAAYERSTKEIAAYNTKTEQLNASRARIYGKESKAVDSYNATTAKNYANYNAQGSSTWTLGGVDKTFDSKRSAQIYSQANAPVKPRSIMNRQPTAPEVWTYKGSDKQFSSEIEANTAARMDAASKASRTVTVNGKTRTFKDKATAQKFVSRTSEGSYIGYSPEGKAIQGPVKPETSYIGFGPTGKAIQGPAQPTQSVAAPAGSLEYITKQQAPEPTKYSNVPYIDKAKELLGGLTKSVTEYSEKTDTTSGLPLAVVPGMGATSSNKDVLRAGRTLAVGATAYGLGLVGGIVNLAEGGNQLIREQLGMKPEQLKPVYTPRSSYDVGISKATEGIVNLDNPTAPIQLDKFNLKQGLKAASEARKEYGHSPTLAMSHAVPDAIMAAFIPSQVAGIATKASRGITNIGSKITKTPKVQVTSGVTKVGTSRPASQTAIIQDGIKYNKVEVNPFGKERQIPYAIKQGVERVKNIQLPTVNTPFVITNAIKQTKGTLQYAKYTIKESLPSVGVPQSVKNIGTGLKSSVIEQAGYTKRQAQLMTSRNILEGQLALKTVVTKVQPIVNPIKAGVTKLKTGSSTLKQGVNVQIRKAEVAGTMAKYKVQTKYGTLKSTASNKIDILKKGLDGENKSIYQNKKWDNIANRYEPFKSPSTPKSLIDIKNKAQGGIQKLGKWERTQSAKIDIGIKMKTQPIKMGIANIKSNLSKAKSDMFKVLPEEYSGIKPKTIVENAKPQALKNRLRTDPQSPNPMDFGKQGASPGQLGRGQLNNILSDVSRKIGINPRKNFNIPTVKPKQNIIGPKQPVDLPKQNIGKTPFKTPNLSSNINTPKIRPSVDLPARQLGGGVPLKFKPNAVEILKAKEIRLKLKRSKMGYGKQTTELEGKVNQAKTISGQAKQKIGIKEFDTPKIKTANINPKQGAPKGFMGKGLLDDIVKSAQATAKPKTGTPTDITRIMKGKDTGLSGLKKSGKTRRREQTELDNVRPPSSTGGDMTIGKGSSQMAPLIVKHKPVLPKIKKKLQPKVATFESKVVTEGVKATPRTRTAPPMIRITNKKKPKPISSSAGTIAYEYTRTNAPTARSIATTSTTASFIGLTAVTSKQNVVQTPRLNTSITPKLSTSTTAIQKQVPIQTQKTPAKQQSKQISKTFSAMGSPTAPKLDAAVAPKFGTQTRQKYKYAEPPRPPSTRRKIPFVFPWVDGDEKKKSKKGKGKKQKDFLGNTRTDNIVGLFRRTEIVSGDKRSAKQLTKDKRYKEKTPQTKSTKKKLNMFGGSFTQPKKIASKGTKTRFF